MTGFVLLCCSSGQTHAVWGLLITSLFAKNSDGSITQQDFFDTVLDFALQEEVASPGAHCTLQQWHGSFVLQLNEATGRLLAALSKSLQALGVPVPQGIYIGVEPLPPSPGD